MAFIPTLRTFRVRLINVLSLGLFFALPRLALSQAKIDVTTGFDNNYRTNNWTPLHVDLSGFASNSPAKLQVVVNGPYSSNVYTSLIRLNSASPKQSFSTSYYQPGVGQAKSIVVQVVVDNKTIATKKIENTVNIPENTPAIVALTPDNGGLNYLGSLDTGYNRNPGSASGYDNGYGGVQGSEQVNGVKVFNRVIYPKPMTLPDASALYKGIDCLLLGDISNDLLTEDQWQALDNYVREGGILVVSGSSDLNRLKSKQLTDLLPISPIGIQSLSNYEGLKNQYGAGLSVASVPVVTGKLKSDALALCQQDGLPLVSERVYGAGVVIFTSFDINSAVFKSWSGQDALWREIMTRGSRTMLIADALRKMAEPVDAGRFGGRTNTGLGTLSDALAGLQASDAPSFQWIGIFLVIYIIVLVPGNYLVLKALDKKEYAWVSLIATIAVFTLAAYGIGYKVKGGKLTLNYCTVLEGSSDSPKFRSFSVASIFSPRQTRYRLSVSDPNANSMEVTEGANQFARSEGDIEIERETRTTINNLLVNMWDHRSFEFDSHANLEGTIVAEPMHIDASSLTLKVTNTTKYPMHDVAYYYKGNIAIIGDMEPAASKSVKMALQQSTGSMQVVATAPKNAPIATRQIKDSLASSVSLADQNRPATLTSQLIATGWIDEQQIGISLDGEQPLVQGATLVVVHIPSPAGPGVAPKPDDYKKRENADAPRIGGTNIVAPSGMNASALNNLAYTYANRADYKRALSTALQALKQAPNDSNILDTVGEMYQKNKMYPQAVTYFKKAIDQQGNGGIPETHFKYGQTLLLMGKKDNAIEQFKVAANQPSDPFGSRAVSELLKLGVATNPSVPAGSTIFLGPNQMVPAIPSVGKGNRRYVKPIANGRMIIDQKWDFTGPNRSQSTKTTFAPNGTPLPR